MSLIKKVHVDNMTEFVKMFVSSHKKVIPEYFGMSSFDVEIDDFVSESFALKLENEMIDDSFRSDEYLLFNEGNTYRLYSSERGGQAKIYESSDFRRAIRAKVSFVFSACASSLLGQVKGRPK